MGQSALSPERLEQLHAALIGIAATAGEIALRDFTPGRRTSATIHWKDGGSPVTDADLAVDAYLGEALAGLSDPLAPIGFHSEERPESWHGDPGHPVFVVDPIDGTRNFSEGGDAWCIVIGLLDQGRPVAGVVHVPARQETYSAWRGGGAYLNGKNLAAPLLTASAMPAQPLRITGPRVLSEKLAHRLGAAFQPIPAMPALAHRVLVPLTGGADLALARPGGHDWDIVASDCILVEAGARLVSLDGAPPAYRLQGGEHPALMAGSQSLMEKFGLLEKFGASLLTDPA